MKHTLYVPLMSGTLCESTLPKYIEMLRRLGASHVFIAVEREHLFEDARERARLCESIRANTSALESAGFSVGVWIQAFGFGTPLSPAGKQMAARYTPLRSVSGKSRAERDMFCPENPHFLSDYLSLVEDVVRAGCRTLMLDDDLCLSVRPGIGCTCERHLQLLSEQLGEQVSAEVLADHAFVGAPNKYRTAFLKVMGNTLASFARRVRAKVDSIDPDVRVGFCAGYTSWDIEGIDAISLTKILAGNTAPFLRLTGAPYWAARSQDRFKGQPLGAIIEDVRAQESAARGSGVEIFFEADTYPRPRYFVPSSYLECFSLPLVANGGMGELGYFFDYHSSPDYEAGYLKHRLHNAPLYEFIERNFADKRACGVRVYQHTSLFEDATLPAALDEKGVMRLHFNRGAEMVCVHGIPTVYGEECECGIAFGEHARALTALPSRLIIDARAASLLAERGIDVGLSSKQSAPTPSFECTDTERILLGAAPADAFFRFDLKDGARVLSTFESEDGCFPAAYTYRSGDTEFLVFAFDADALPYSSGAVVSYLRAEQLRDFCAGAPMPTSRATGVYQICKKDAESCAMLFVNISEDPLLDFEVALDGQYARAELCGAQGVLGGGKLSLTSAVAPFGAFAVVLRE